MANAAFSDSDIITIDMPEYKYPCNYCNELHKTYAQQVKDVERLCSQRDKNDIVEQADEWRRLDRFVTVATQLEAHKARRIIVHVQSHIREL